MKSLLQAHSLAPPMLAWPTVAAAGLIVPALALLVLANVSEPTTLASFAGPVLAASLMGTGIIGAASAGRFWIGIALALLAGCVLLLLIQMLGEPSIPNLLSIGVACLVASVSFAARGVLFARSLSDKGWLMALAVVAGEAAILLTSAAAPGMWPDWLLALLPAQWSAMALQVALDGAGPYAAVAALVALGGTAAATLLVAKLWPRRWPYLIMFSTWLALSAFVYDQHAPFA